MTSANGEKSTTKDTIKSSENESETDKNKKNINDKENCSIM